MNSYHFNLELARFVVKKWSFIRWINLILIFCYFRLFLIFAKLGNSISLLRFWMELLKKTIIKDCLWKSFSNIYLNQTIFNGLYLINVSQITKVMIDMELLFNKVENINIEAYTNSLGIMHDFFTTILKNVKIIQNRLQNSVEGS